MNNLIMHACCACKKVCDFGSSCWVRSQLRRFQTVRASFGSRMDVERIQKVRFVVKYRYFYNLFCISYEPRCFSPLCTTLCSDGRDCILFTYKWSGRGIQSRKNHLRLRTSDIVSGEYSVSVRVCNE